MENLAPRAYPRTDFTPRPKPLASSDLTPRRVLGDITNKGCTPLKGEGHAFKTPSRTPKMATPRRRREAFGSQKKQKCEATPATPPSKPSRRHAARAEPKAIDDDSGITSSDESEVDYMHPSDTPSPKPSFFDSNGNEICIDLKEFPFKVPDSLPPVNLAVDLFDVANIQFLEMVIPGMD